MILWTFAPHHTETSPAWEGAPLRSWRWAIETALWSKGVSLSLNEQYHSTDDPGWSLAARYYTVAITKAWKIGSFHAYYDGPHCGLSFGFLHFTWSADWCTKCMPDPSGECPVTDFIEQIIAAAMDTGAQA